MSGRAPEGSQLAAEVREATRSAAPARDPGSRWRVDNQLWGTISERSPAGGCLAVAAALLLPSCLVALVLIALMGGRVETKVALTMATCSTTVVMVAGLSFVSRLRRRRSAALQRCLLRVYLPSLHPGGILHAELSAALGQGAELASSNLSLIRLEQTQRQVALTKTPRGTATHATRIDREEREAVLSEALPTSLAAAKLFRAELPLPDALPPSDDHTAWLIRWELRTVDGQEACLQAAVPVFDWSSAPAPADAQPED